MNNNNSSNSADDDDDSDGDGGNGSTNSNTKLTFSVFYFILFYFCSLHMFTYATVSEAPYLSHDNAQNYTKMYTLMTTRPRNIILVAIFGYFQTLLHDFYRSFV